MKVAAVVLAAGASTRLGEPKQLVMLGGERLLERAVRVALEAGCTPVIVVLGCRSQEIMGLCNLGSARIMENPAWAEGMASSLRLGVGAVPETCAGVVLMTCDQPAVTADHLNRLIALGRDGAAAVPVSSRYAGRQGVPAFFPPAQFEELMQLQGDAGARSLLRHARAVELPAGELDIDTPDSLEAARRLFA
jgi:CTP:molybdopterin cytidylyltransferase MocA